MKMLLWFLIGFFVVMWYLHIKKSRQQAARRRGDADSNAASGSSPGPASDNGSDAAASAAAAPETMLRCAQCGLYIPSSEAVTAADGRLSYCSDEHRLHHSG